MIENGKVLAIIPARGGSKRYPRKNIAQLCGKPLIAWSIEAGLQSKYVDRVVVSTDDEEISRAATRYGADVPFIRPENLSHDTATTIDTVIHAINEVENESEKYRYILLLQPTSPLRNAQHIDRSVETLIEKNADSIVGVTEVSHPVEWTNTLPIDASMDDFISDEVYFTRSQDFPKRYRINGAIYLIKKSSLITSGKMISKNNSFAHIMSKFASVDIDDQFDFMMAETILGGGLNQ